MSPRTVTVWNRNNVKNMRFGIAFLTEEKNEIELLGIAVLQFLKENNVQKKQQQNLRYNGNLGRFCRLISGRFSAGDS